jgi:transcriptional antiterminator NusG
LTETDRTSPLNVAFADDQPASGQARHWHVLWTRSNFEQQVHDRLAASGYEPFLPKVARWSRRSGRRRLAQAPLFPGYLFLRHAMDRASYLRILRMQGLVRVLGSGWDRLEAVPEREIDAIRRALACELPHMPHAYLRTGQAVRIVDGPLKGVEGILASTDRRTGLLVLTIEVLRQGLAVEVDCTQVAVA